MKTLKVSENKRYLTDCDGKPFFFIGDTAWELFHCLTKEDADYYLKTRAQQGFNVIQAVLLADDGLSIPNAYGKTPLKRNQHFEYDPLLPDVSATEYDYWKHVDYIVDKAAEYGLYVGLTATWGDKINRRDHGIGPVIFNPENAFFYGKWLGERYQSKDNVIWILGGDRSLDNDFHYQVVDAMASGLTAGDGGKFLKTFHPCGLNTSSNFVHDRDWLDFNMTQSGHLPEINNSCYEIITRDYEKYPIKPVLDGEPCYEDHPICFNPDNGFFDAFNVRNAMYWNAFSGACGNTYGHHSIWSFTTEPDGYFIMDWKTAINRPGANHVRIYADFIKEYPLYCCVPDRTSSSENKHGANYIASCRCEHYALFYIPNGLTTTLNLKRLDGMVSAHYFDVRTGEHLPSFSIPESGVFTPPSSGRDNDWVLILEDK